MSHLPYCSLSLSLSLVCLLQTSEEQNSLSLSTLNKLMDSSSTRNENYEEYSLSSILNNLPQPPPPPPPPPPPTSSSSSPSFFDPFPSYLPTFNHHIPFANPNPNPNPTQPSSSSPPPPLRASKKRSRASRRAPTTVLTTNTSNFRAMVQEFTGFPTPPFPPPSSSSSSSFLLRTAPSPSLLNINYPLSAMNIASSNGGSASRNSILAGLLQPQFGLQELKDADNDGDGGSGRADKRLKGGWSFSTSLD